MLYVEVKYIMLFSIETVLTEVDSKLLYALAIPEPVKTSDHPWSCVCIKLTPPHPIFRLTAKYAAVDAIETGTALTVYSEKLLGVLKQFNVKFEAFPIEIAADYEDIVLKYYIFHLLEEVRYERERMPDENGKMIRLPLSKRWPDELPNMFRNANKT